MAEVILADELGVKKDGDHYILHYNDQPIFTPGGRPIRAKKGEMLELLKSEFVSLGFEEIELQDRAVRTPRFLGVYTIFSTQLDFVETDGVSLEEWRSWAAGDRSIFVLNNTPMEHEPEFVSRAFDALEQWGVPSVPTASRGLEFNAYLARIMEKLTSLYPWEKSVVINLYSVHNGHMLPSLLLATGDYNANDYASVVTVSELMNNMLDDTSSEGRLVRCRELEFDAQACIAYLGFW